MVSVLFDWPIDKYNGNVRVTIVQAVQRFNRGNATTILFAKCHRVKTK